VRLPLAVPEFGPRELYANLGRAAGQDDDGVFAVIWNPADQASPALARSARGRSLAAFCFDDHASSDRLPGCWGFS